MIYISIYILARHQGRTESKAKGDQSVFKILAKCCVFNAALSNENAFLKHVPN